MCIFISLIRYTLSIVYELTDPQNSIQEKSHLLCQRLKDSKIVPLSQDPPLLGREHADSSGYILKQVDHQLLVVLVGSSSNLQYYTISYFDGASFRFTSVGSTCGTRYIKTRSTRWTYKCKSETGTASVTKPVKIQNAWIFLAFINITIFNKKKREIVITENWAIIPDNLHLNTDRVFLLLYYLGV